MCNKWKNYFRIQKFKSTFSIQRQGGETSVVTDTIVNNYSGLNRRSQRKKTDKFYTGARCCRCHTKPFNCCSCTSLSFPVGEIRDVKQARCTSHTGTFVLSQHGTIHFTNIIQQNTPKKKRDCLMLKMIYSHLFSFFAFSARSHPTGYHLPVHKHKGDFMSCKNMFTMCLYISFSHTCICTPCHLFRFSKTI